MLTETLKQSFTEELNSLGYKNLNVNIENFKGGKGVSSTKLTLSRSNDVQAILSKGEPWLYRDKTYEMFGSRQKYVGYKAFVELGVDEETLSFYNKGNFSSVIGDRGFKETLSEQK